MKVTETFRNAEQLRTGGIKEWTREANQVCIMISPDTFTQLTTRHPFRDELEGFECGALEGGTGFRFHLSLIHSRNTAEFGFQCGVMDGSFGAQKNLP